MSKDTDPKSDSKISVNDSSQNSVEKVPNTSIVPISMRVSVIEKYPSNEPNNSPVSLSTVQESFSQIRDIIDIKSELDLTNSTNEIRSTVSTLKMSSETSVSVMSLDDNKFSDQEVLKIDLENSETNVEISKEQSSGLKSEFLTDVPQSSSSETIESVTSSTLLYNPTMADFEQIPESTEILSDLAVETQPQDVFSVESGSSSDKSGPFSDKSGPSSDKSGSFSDKSGPSSDKSGNPIIFQEEKDKENEQKEHGEKEDDDDDDEEDEDEQEDEDKEDEQEDEDKEDEQEDEDKEDEQEDEDKEDEQEDEDKEDEKDEVEDEDENIEKSEERHIISTVNDVADESVFDDDDDNDNEEEEENSDYDDQSEINGCDQDDDDNDELMHVHVPKSTSSFLDYLSRSQVESKPADGTINSYKHLV
jgi:hypothetical protein